MALLPFLLWALLAFWFFPALPGWLTVPVAAIGLGAIGWGNWKSNFAGRWLAAGASLVVAVGIGYFLARPATDGDWISGHASQAAIEIADDAITIANFRNTTYSENGEPSVQWKEAVFQLSELEHVYFVHSILSARGAIAHGFLSFGFADGRYLSVSVEARRQVDQDYSPLRGMFRNYSLIYVFGEETDLIGGRATIEGTPVYLYPVRASPEQARKLFQSLAAKANRLSDQPEFYHTVRNNCVTTLLRHVNETVETPISYSWKIFVSGFADQVLHDLDLLDFDGSVSEARERFLINDRSLPLGEPSEWSAQVRRAPGELSQR